MSGREWALTRVKWAPFGAGEGKNGVRMGTSLLMQGGEGGK